ncbi:MAG: 50S ribosomal protein L19 [Candidatus Omnitrophota bacterium]
MVSPMEKLKNIEKKYLKSDSPQLKIGDTVKMMIKTQEADKVRLHPFEGTVIRKRGGGINATFTVRKISFGEGVERTFPFNSPVIDSLKVISGGVSHRAKLYYLRGRLGKQSKVKRKEEQSNP